MKARCLCKSNNMYPRYGGSGVTIDPAWLDYDTFLRDMGERPEGHSLDRKDGNKGYSKENCRWATPSRQNRNRRHHTLIRFNGKAQTLADWADETGINRNLLSWRFIKGWSAERALTEPPNPKKGRAHVKACGIHQ
jgi:hypothetical protein